MTGNRLDRLGLCCLLLVNVLLWSAPSLVPLGKEGQFEQLTATAKPFLVKHWDSPNDEPATYRAPRSFAILSSYKPVQARFGESVERRIRISSYPVVPQAPPSLV
mgnify:CR=1 FL=1